MTRSFVFALATVLVCSLALADDQSNTGAGQGGMTQGQSQDQMHGDWAKRHQEQTQAISNQISQMDQAVMKGDMDPVQNWFTRDFTLIEPQGQLTTRDQWFGNLKNGKVKYTDIKRQEDQIRIHGNTAVETGVMSFKGQENGRDISGNYGYTHVWVQRPDGQWACVAAQLTPLMGEPSQAGYQMSGQQWGGQSGGDMNAQPQGGGTSDHGMSKEPAGQH